MHRFPFVYALATMSGTIIGVGLFSLPYITVKVGLWVMLTHLIILGGVTIVTSWCYGEVVLRTTGSHRLPGYVEKYLGLRYKAIAFLTAVLGFYGSILAYMLVGGQFLNVLLSQWFGNQEQIATLIFFFFGTALIFFGIKSIAQTELIALCIFFVVLGFIFFRGLPDIHFSNLMNFDLSQFFLPYGPVLFALSGMSLIPELKEMLQAKPASLKKIITYATVTAGLTYLVFVILVTGVTGEQTSKEALTGLNDFFSGRLLVFILLFGLITTFTSLITIGLSLKRVFSYDFKIPERLAWALVVIVPLILYFIGLNNFIGIISVTGGVMLAIDISLIILIFLKAKNQGDQKPAYEIKLPKAICYLLIICFIVGMIYELIYSGLIFTHA